MGAALALIASEMIAQFGVLFVIIVGETLTAPDTAHAVSRCNDANDRFGRSGCWHGDQALAARRGNPALSDRVRDMAGRDVAAGEPVGE